MSKGLSEEGYVKSVLAVHNFLWSGLLMSSGEIFISFVHTVRQ